MILDATRLAGRNLFAPETRSAFWKTLGVTLLLLVGAWFGIEAAFARFALPPLESLLPGIPAWAGWLGFVVGLIAGIGLALAFALLIAPVTAVVAGLFLDEVAEVIEARDYPRQPREGRCRSVAATGYTVRFLGVVILGNLVALRAAPGARHQRSSPSSSSTAICSAASFSNLRHMRFRREGEVRQLRSKYSLPRSSSPAC